MELFLGEHGKGIASAVISIMVMLIVASSLKLMSNELPIFNTNYSKDNSFLIAEMKQYTPSIMSEDVIYAEYQADFNLKEFIKVLDYDNVDLTDEIKIDENINVNQKGVYPVMIEVSNSRGYSARKRVYVIVE